MKSGLDQVTPASQKAYEQAIVQTANKIVVEGNLYCDFLKLGTAFNQAYITFHQKLKELNKQYDDKIQMSLASAKDCSIAFRTAKSLIADMEKALDKISKSSPDYNKFSGILVKNKAEFKDMSGHNMDTGKKLQSQLETAAKMKAANQSKSSPQVNPQTSTIITPSPLPSRSLR